jgi:hypothetical protein
VKAQTPEGDTLDASPLPQHNRLMKEFDDKTGTGRKTGQKIGNETEAEILPFRARRKPEAAHPSAKSPVQSRPIPEAMDRDDPIEPLSNGALLKIGLLIVGLIAGGVWLMNALRDAGRLEDCAMQGRRNCMPISTPDRNQ